MHFFFGGSAQNDKKITNDFITQIKTSLANQFCQFCNKQSSTKVAFVPQLKNGFTCNKCEVQAVGNDYKNLGEKNLITNDKLSETVTKALINYQNIQAQSPQPVKEIENDAKSLIKVSSQTAEKIKGQMKLLKITTQGKLNELVKTSQTQNSSILFEQLIKKSQQKKPNTEEVIQLLCKKSLVNNKGLHFIDTESIQKMNSEVDQRVSNLKSQLKIKLKEIDQLTSWINAIQL